MSIWLKYQSSINYMQEGVRYHTCTWTLRKCWEKDSRERRENMNRTQKGSNLLQNVSMKLFWEVWMASPSTNLDRNFAPTKLVQWQGGKAKALPNCKDANKKWPKTAPFRLCLLLITLVDSFPSLELKLSPNYSWNWN